MTFLLAVRWRINGVNRSKRSISAVESASVCSPRWLNSWITSTTSISNFSKASINGISTILCLLLQPAVNNIWRSVFGNGYNTSQNLIWGSSVIKTLQLQPEVSEDAADILTLAAFNGASWHLQHQVQADRASTVDLADQQLQTSQDVSTT